MKSILSIIKRSIHFFCFITALTAVQAQAAESNLGSNNLAIDGYDPVSYFSEKPEKGVKSITSVYDDATYYFQSEANKEAFLATPEKFVPAYGGWCAWAMIDGAKASIDPLSYKIIDGKNYLFHKSFFGGNTLKSWNKKIANTAESELVEKADSEWAAL